MLNTRMAILRPEPFRLGIARHSRSHGRCLSWTRRHYLRRTLGLEV